MRNDQAFANNPSGRLLPLKSAEYFRLFFFLTAFVSAFFLSGTTAPHLDLDQSWQAVLEHASRHRLQFGTEILFTYGPLNYLNLPFSQGFFLPQRTIFAIIWGLIAAASATIVAVRLNGPSRLLFAVWFLVFSATGELEQHVFMVIACGGGLLLDTRSNLKAAASCWLVMIAILSLVKFNFLIASVMTVIVAMTVHLLRRDIGKAAVIAAGYGGFLLLFWLLCGQSLQSLPAWFTGSLEIAAGYSEAMSLTPPTALLACCVILMVLIIASCCLISWACPRNLISSAELFLLAGYAFLSWKHGMVRAGGEITYNFVTSVPILFGLLLAIPNRKDCRKIGTSLSVIYLLTIVLTIVAAEQTDNGVTWHKMLAWPRQMTANLRQIDHIVTGKWQRNFEALQPGFRIQEEPDLRLARSLIGNASVDVLNCLQWSALSNRLNYRPRPVIQGYSVFTPHLQLLNLDFFRSGTRPEFLLFNPETIDDRLETLDDAAVLPYVFSNYFPVGQDKGFAILRTRTESSEAAQLTPLGEVITGFNQAVDLSTWSDRPLVMQVEMTETFGGRFRKFFYQPPAIIIRLKTDSSILTRRFVPSMGRLGFIVSPVIATAHDVISLYRGNWQAVTAIEFVKPDPEAWGYSDRIKIKVSGLELNLDERP
jgi:hypothetical protein